MKFIESIVNKFGSDKIMHFLCGSVITSLVSFVVILQEGNIGLMSVAMVLIGAVFAGFAGLVKEMADQKFDVKDLIATVLGSVPTFIAVLIGMLFNILSK